MCNETKDFTTTLQVVPFRKPKAPLRGCRPGRLRSARMLPRREAPHRACVLWTFKTASGPGLHYRGCWRHEHLIVDVTPISIIAQKMAKPNDSFHQRGRIVINFVNVGFQSGLALAVSVRFHTGRILHLWWIRFDLNRNLCMRVSRSANI